MRTKNKTYTRKLRWTSTGASDYRTKERIARMVCQQWITRKIAREVPAEFEIGRRAVWTETQHKYIEGLCPAWATLKDAQVIPFYLVAWWYPGILLALNTWCTVILAKLYYKMMPLIWPNTMWFILNSNDIGWKPSSWVDGQVAWRWCLSTGHQPSSAAMRQGKQWKAYTCQAVNPKGVIMNMIVY